jgi:hypothetical protein
MVLAMGSTYGDWLESPWRLNPVGVGGFYAYEVGWSLHEMNGHLVVSLLSDDEGLQLSSSSSAPHLRERIVGFFYSRRRSRRLLILSPNDLGTAHQQRFVDSHWTPTALLSI